MVLAPLAVLLELNTLRIVLLVLFGRVVTTLALSASKRDQSAHYYSFIANTYASFRLYT